MEEGNCKMLTGQRMQRLFQHGEADIAQLHSLYAVVMVADREEVDSTATTKEGDHSWLNPTPSLHSLAEGQTCDSLHALLIEFQDLFAEPTALPPIRFLGHAIHLKPNTEPVNVQSYRYSPFQKGEIEKLVKDMLTKSIIQPSQSFCLTRPSS